MRRRTLVLFLAVFLAVPLLGQSAQKLAAINKKIVGKWVSSDGTNYLEFRADGACSDGAFYDSKWHIEEGKLFVWEKGESFMCDGGPGGALTLIGPNVFTRDHGMGGDLVKYYRRPQNPRPNRKS